MAQLDGVLLQGLAPLPAPGCIQMDEGSILLQVLTA